jgi:hypothetical protein
VVVAGFLYGRQIRRDAAALQRVAANNAERRRAGHKMSGFDNADY